MERITVVGSGPSGVHFALTLLRKGYPVTMLDVGAEPPPPTRPDLSFAALKDLDRPTDYFLGDDFRGAFLPSFDDEFYGIPPSKDYVFTGSHHLPRLTEGFAPLFSFARGGLAEAWTGGCYPFNDDELLDFPFGYADLESAYSEISKRIGITGADDDLAPVMPVHDHLLEPIPLDDHSRALQERYAKHRGYLQRRLRARIGRTRVATLTSPRGDRGACTLSGRCLWGCPHGSLYTPTATLAECVGFSNFTYIPGVRVEWFRTDDAGRATAAVATSVQDGTLRDFPFDTLALAAGALSSTRIMLRSHFARNGEIARLPGLMDNRQVLMPFLNLGMVGKPFDNDSYQYHLLGLGIDADDPRHYVHGQITTLKSAMIHAVAKQMPVDLRTAVFVMRSIHAALGVVNLNFHDTRRATNVMTLDGEDPERGTLVMHYTPPGDESDRVRRAMHTTKRLLRRLGCLVPPGMSHLRPMGASVHYAGTLPMQVGDGGPWTTDRLGRSRAFPNVFVVDGATFPFLPAKNITFTLMANAHRIADRAF